MRGKVFCFADKCYFYFGFFNAEFCGFIVIK